LRMKSFKAIDGITTEDGKEPRVLVGGLGFLRLPNREACASSRRRIHRTPGG